MVSAKRKNLASEKLPKTYEVLIEAFIHIRESIEKRTHSGNKHSTKFEDMASLKSSVIKQLELINGLFDNVIEMHAEVKEAHDKKEQAMEARIDALHLVITEKEKRIEELQTAKRQSMGNMSTSHVSTPSFADVAKTRGVIINGNRGIDLETLKQ